MRGTTYYLAAVVFLLTLAVPAAAAPPAGFVSEPYVTLPFLATDLEFAPDGRLFALDKTGAVRIIKDGQLTLTPFLSLTVTSDKERGLLGIAFDPKFVENRSLYLYYTTGPGSLRYSGSPKNRLVRVRASADNPDLVELGSETILLDNVASDAGVHNGGQLRVGPDGKLYAATGDGGQRSQKAQDLAGLNGKILRLNLDGSVPRDNPFVGRPGARGEVWAYGLRNPWRFAFDSTTGTMLIADVGSNKAEEVNVGQRGANYGWPMTEGVTPAGVPGVTYPIYSYRHATGESETNETHATHAHQQRRGASIIGGEVYTGTQFPEPYRGSYFFGDFVQNFIRRLVLDQSGQLTLVEDFDPDGGWMIDFAIGPDGALYYSVGESQSTGRVQRVAYVGGAALPPILTAAATAAPAFGRLPLTVQFTARQPATGAERFTYQWDFGDGSRGSGPSVRHTYRRRGAHRVVLTVLNNRGGTAKDYLTVTAGSTPPRAEITALSATRYAAGDVIRFSGSGTDREEGRLAPAQLAWEVIFHHADHTHPFLGPLTGLGQFTVPADGEADSDVWFEVRLTATDRTGLRHAVSRRVTPRRTAVTLVSSVPGAALTLDGSPLFPPHTVTNVVGFPRTIAAPERVSYDGQWYRFDRWSDGGAREHVVTPSDEPLIATAHYVAE